MSKKQKAAEVTTTTVETAEVAPVATATVKTPTRYEIRKTKLDALTTEFHARVKKLREDREALRIAHKEWIAKVYEPARQAIEAEFEASRKVIVVKKEVEAGAEAPAKVEA